MGKSCWLYPLRQTACCTMVIVYTLFYSTTGLTLSPCGSDNTVELLETRIDNNITCGGIPDVTWNVNWELMLPGRTPDIVGTCPASSTTCTSATAIGYSATRPSSDTSVMTIDPGERVVFVRNGTLECKVTKSAQPAQNQRCQLDIVSLPLNVTCTVRLDTIVRKVIGHCDITKVYSYNGRYSCEWYSKQGSEVETNITAVAIQTATTADLTPTNGNYSNVSCDVSTISLQGNTSYRVVIFPGGVSHYAGNIESGPEEARDYCLLCLLLLLLLLLPLPIPLPWPGYPIYVALCRIPNQGSSTDNWHTHYICGRRTNNVYFSACVVTNDGRAVLIWSNSPTTGLFVCYGTETTSGTNSNVSAASGAANNGNQQTRQKEKNKHTGTDGSKDSS